MNDIGSAHKPQMCHLALSDAVYLREHLSNTPFIQSKNDAVMIREQLKAAEPPAGISLKKSDIVIDHFNESGSVAVLAVSNQFNNGKVEAQREIK